MSIPDLMIREIRARPAVAPLPRPIRTASGDVMDAPLLYSGRHTLVSTPTEADTDRANAHSVRRRAQPRSSTRIPGRKSSAVASHSVNHSALAPPLTLAMTHSGWYFDERGNRSETNRLSEVMWISFCRTTPLSLLHTRRSSYLGRGRFPIRLNCRKGNFRNGLRQMVKNTLFQISAD
jgi:hypothetical protein